MVTIIGVPQDKDSKVANPKPSASDTLTVISAMLYITAKFSGGTFAWEINTCPSLKPQSFKIIFIS